MARANNKDDSVLLTVGGASTTDTSQTFSISSESTETETPKTKRLAVAMPAKEIPRPNSSPQSNLRIRSLALPAPTLANERENAV